VGNELNEPPETGQAHHDEKRAGHQSRGQEARETVLGRDGSEDDDERRGRAGDLVLRPTGERDDDPRDDCHVEPVLRRDADRDREGHRQRERHDPHDDSRQRILAQSRK
jgi:hypothetical protein